MNEGKAALRAQPHERVSLALTVLPRLVAALDEIVQKQDRFHALRMALTIAVSELRTEVWTGMRDNPDNTANGGRIAARLRAVNDVLDRLIVEMASDGFGGSRMGQVGG